MKNFYIKNTKKFDVLDKLNRYAPISQSKNENFKNLFQVENLYENCNENTNHIETEILAKDYEDIMKKKLENVINKINNRNALSIDDKGFLRILALQMSIRGPYGVKAILTEPTSPAKHFALLRKLKKSNTNTEQIIV